jgi:hypothetical protein
MGFPPSFLARCTCLSPPNHRETSVIARSNGISSSRLPSHVADSLLDPRFDSDSCGVGFVAQLSAEPSHTVLTHALTALARLAHRGAVAADGKSSDGVGVTTAIPRA